MGGDRRSIFLTELEAEIQQRAIKKDPKLVLTGEWKRLVGRENGFAVYAVNGEWVRNNLCAMFGHGGHGYVHEFIPLNEVWVSIRHYKGCGCENLKRGYQQVSQEYFESTIIHEITEYQEMKKGTSFYEAHQIALSEEVRAGLLKNPHREIG